MIYGIIKQIIQNNGNVIFLNFRFVMEKSVGSPSFEEIQIPVPFGYVSGKY